MPSLIDVIPVASQIKSLVQACCNDNEGALATQEAFSRQCPIVSQVRSAVHASMGDSETARNIQMQFVNQEFVDVLPVVSQVKSLVQACISDNEGAKATQEIFSRKCPVISQSRWLLHHCVFSRTLPTMFGGRQAFNMAWAICRREMGEEFLSHPQTWKRPW